MAADFNSRAALLCASALVMLLSCFMQRADAIGCFVCSSINSGTPGCEDTFNNTDSFYHSDCMAGRKGRNGYFPATQCIKMIAYNETHRIMVRQCVVDNGDINSETEIGRSTHCYTVQLLTYNNRLMRGCILSCDTDGCNHAPPTTATWRRPLNLMLTLAVAVWMTSYKSSSLS